MQHATHGCECGEGAMKKEKKRGKGVIDFTEKETETHFFRKGESENSAPFCVVFVLKR